MRTLIRNATVLTINPDNPVLTAGAVLIDGDRIVDIGVTDAVEQVVPGAQRVIDATGKAVLPGFVSAHNHLGYAIFRSRAEDFGYGAGRHLYLPMAAVLSREERKAIGTLSAAELLRGGCTTIFEMEEDADVLVSSIEALGMRACLGVMVNDVDLDKLATGETQFSPQRCEAQLTHAIGFAESYQDKASSRITPVLAANGLATSSPTQLRALRDAADRLGTRLSVHLGTGEGAFLEHLYGAGTVEFARDNGCLAPDVVAVHGYKLTDDDVRAFATTGAHLAHCPQINSFRGLIAPARQFLDAGVNVGLGVDNFFSDYFDVMRSCIAVARIKEQDPRLLPASQVLTLATLGGARTMGLDSLIGSLEIGKRADLQIIDMRRFGLSPMDAPAAALVYHGHAKDVESVMIDGEFVVENGTVRGVDERMLVDAASGAAAGAWHRFNERFDRPSQGS